MPRETPLQIVRRKVSELKHGPNFRSDLGSEQKLIRHGKSVRKRQRTPLLILPDGTVLDGNRTLAAARLVGIEELDCVVIDEGFDPDSVRYRVTQWHANEHRQSLIPYDKALASRAIKADHPGMSNRELAEEVLNIDPGLLTKYLSLFKCDRKTQEEAKAGKLTVNEWYASKAAGPAPALNGSTPNGRPKGDNGKPSTKLIRHRVPVTAGADTGTVAIELPEDATLAALKTFLDQAKIAIGLPQVKMTPPSDGVPATVTLSTKAIDAQAVTLLDAVLKKVQDAKAPKQSVKSAMVDWQDLAKPAHSAKATSRSRTARRRPPPSPDHRQFSQAEHPGFINSNR